jgi:UDP-N-acetylmuramoylalanine--D-glutamate ligase
MFNLQKYQNKNIAIYGLGITGLSAAKTLKKLNAKIYCWDDKKKIRNRAAKLGFKINKFWLNKNLLTNIVISPGIDIKKCKIKKYLKKNFSKIITDLDIFFDLNKDALFISITGTNGKSTTCKIIEKILKTGGLNVKTVGNIGNPILFSKKNQKENIFILEVSSYQLEYSRLIRSRHAAILNISPDHLERHGNMKNYIKAKSKIFLAQKKSDYSYINSTNKYFINIKKIHKESNIKSKLITINKFKYNFLLKKINNKYFNSQGNFENLIFAYKIAKSLKISDKTIIKSINSFKGLPHRQEIVFSNKKILCINDSKATSFDASIQSLLIHNKIYWIVGGIPKHKDYFDLKKIKKRIEKAYIVGKNISFFKKKLKNNIPYKISGNIKNAVNDIYNDLQNIKNVKNTILLSPSAASFDQFNNFEVRGSYFKKLVKKKFSRF